MSTSSSQLFLGLNYPLIWKCKNWKTFKDQVLSCHLSTRLSCCESSSSMRSELTYLYHYLCLELLLGSHYTWWKQEAIFARITVNHQLCLKFLHANASTHRHFPHYLLHFLVITPTILVYISRLLATFSSFLLFTSVGIDLSINSSTCICFLSHQGLRFRVWTLFHS